MRSILKPTKYPFAPRTNSRKQEPIKYYHEPPGRGAANRVSNGFGYTPCMNMSPPLVAFSGDPNQRNYQSEQFALGSLTTITLFHDFLCPWCWIGLFQAKKLTEAFGVTFDWRGAELFPPAMERYSPPPAPATRPQRPPGTHASAVTL